MKIKILKYFFTPTKGYEVDKEYDVSEEDGKAFIERGHAEAVRTVEKKKQEPEQPNDKKSKK